MEPFAWPPFAVFRGGVPVAFEVWSRDGRRIVHNLPEPWARAICSALNRDMESPESLTFKAYHEESAK